MRPLRPLLLLMMLCWLLRGGPCGAAEGAAPGASHWTAAASVFQHLTDPALLMPRAMAQDPQGFLWVGTEANLTRWDGHAARSYVPDPSRPGSLEGDVKALHIDRAGQLWVGTAHGLARFDPTSDAFVPIAAAGAPMHATVWSIVSRPEGGLAVGTSAGLYRMAAGADTLEPEPGAPAGLHINDVLFDRQGRLWLGTLHGMLRRNRGATSFDAVPLPQPAGGASNVSWLHEDVAGRVWIGTRLRGAYVADLAPDRIRKVSDNDTVHGFAEARPGEMWIGTEDGLLRVDAASGAVRRERADLTQKSSLPDSCIYAIFRDANGLVWIGSASALSRIDPSQRAVETVFGGTGPADIPRQVISTLALPDGRVWLASGDSGVDIVDPVRGRVGALRVDATRPADRLPKAMVATMARAADGSVWLGTMGGLYRADADGRRVERIEQPGRSPTAPVFALHFDGPTLWIGGPDCLRAFDGWAAPPLRQRTTIELSKEEQNVRAIATGVHGELWASTSWGLVRIDRQTGAASRQLPDPADPAALTGGDGYLITDRRGRLWVGAFGRGLQVEQGRTPDGRPRFRRLNGRDGLPDLGINAMLEDRDGRIWVSTDDGLAVIDPDTFAVRALGRAQGVGVVRHWGGSATLGPGGELLFGGQGGLNVVHPERFSPHTAAPRPPAVTDASSGGRPLYALGPAGPVTVGSGRGDLMVEFAALDYAQPEAHRYAYRLRGLGDDGWTETPPARRLAAFTHLPPGDYTLELRAGHAGSAVWSEPLALRFTVGRLWHQQPAVRAAGLALLLIALTGAVRGSLQWRLRALERHRRRLEALVAERTAELERRGEDLLASRQQLEQMAYFDALTGLANRRLFNEELRRLCSLAQRGGEPFALLLIDLDRFKHVNDTLGHDVGDALLVHVAQQLQACARESDRVARLGGDEFALLLPQASAQTVEAVCLRILQALGAPLALAGTELKPRASIGAAASPQDAGAPEALYKAADLALYDAKRNGRDTWRRWHAGLANAANAAADAADTSADRALDAAIADAPAAAR